MTEPKPETLAYQSPGTRREHVEVDLNMLGFCTVAWGVLCTLVVAGGTVLIVYLLMSFAQNDAGSTTVLMVTFGALGTLAGVILAVLGHKRLAIVTAIRIVGLVWIALGALLMIGAIVLAVVLGGYAVLAPFYLFGFFGMWAVCAGAALGAAAAGKHAYLIRAELEEQRKRKLGLMR